MNRDNLTRHQFSRPRPNRAAPRRTLRPGIIQLGEGSAALQKVRARGCDLFSGDLPAAYLRLLYGLADANVVITGALSVFRIAAFNASTAALDRVLDLSVVEGWRH